MKITLTEKQAILIEVALDTLCRMTCGQLHTIINGIESMRGNCFPIENIEHNDKSIKQLKSTLFPALHQNESYGVGMKQIGDAQIAYEMVKKLQNFRTRNLPENEGGVMRYEPLHYSKEPLIKVEE